jgi:5,10-methylenetetrahydromethanopterin reductase
MKLSIAFAGDKPLREYAALARQVDGYGFDTLSIYDDLLFKPAWPILSVAAQNSERVRLGPAIVNPYLTHPAMIAANLAMLDELSNGRAYLGIGRGAFLDFLNMDQPRPLRVVREAIEMIQRLLAGDREPYDGEIYQATAGAFFRWKPVRSHVPIMVGTWGPRMCDLAGEIADEVKVSPMWNAPYATVLAGCIAAGEARAGRPKDSVSLTIGVLTSVAEDRDAAKEHARRFVAVYLPYLSPMTENVGIDPEELERVRETSSRGAYDEAARYVSDSSLDSFALYGSPHDLIDKIGEMTASAPVDRIEFGTPHGPNEAEAVRLLGEKVLPHFLK